MEYRLFHIHLESKRLERAETSKNKAINAAETTEEAEKVDKIPVSVYYQYKERSLEEQRAAEGLNPFLPKKDQQDKVKERNSRLQVTENAGVQMRSKGTSSERRRALLEKASR